MWYGAQPPSQKKIRNHWWISWFLSVVRKNGICKASEEERPGREGDIRMGELNNTRVLIFWRSWFFPGVPSGNQVVSELEGCELILSLCRWEGSHLWLLKMFGDFFSRVLTSLWEVIILQRMILKHFHERVKSFCDILLLFNSHLNTALAQSVFYRHLESRKRMWDQIIISKISYISQGRSGTGIYWTAD